MSYRNHTLTIGLLVAAFSAVALAADAGALLAGASRVSITPAPGVSLPMAGYPQRESDSRGVHDDIYVRAIVMSDGTSQAAIVSWELSGVPDPIWARVSARIAAETAIPAENLFLSAVHNHSAPTLTGAYRNASEQSKAYSKQVEDATVRTVQQAKARLQPAKVGAASGKAYVNINRREQRPDGLWWIGHNPDGPSDKTLTVVKFETIAGKAIALLINYGVHAVAMGPENVQISGDLAGATSRFVERYYAGAPEAAPRMDSGYQLRTRFGEPAVEDGVVALWTSAAAGDQNPVTLAKLPDFTVANALGQILGEEAVRVANGIEGASGARLSCAQRAFSCPGREVEPGPRPRKDYKFKDAGPVEIRLSLLKINDIVLAGVSGEVLTPIGQSLKAKAPSGRTILITHTNGSSGYIPDDASFGQVSYEITVSRLKPGCAETGIVSGLLEMMQR